MACTLAILNLPQWECPNKGDLYAMGHKNRSEEWMMRMREIQGAVIVASLAEVVVGYLGKLFKNLQVPEKLKLFKRNFCLL